MDVPGAAGRRMDVPLRLRSVACGSYKWRAYITCARKNSLGTCDTMEEAVATRREAEEQIRDHVMDVNNRTEGTRKGA